ncbi:hypothetical protein CHLRE_11g467561v5 [Chlamydomonas reinhardtii]|uniref:Uncharacterized protein n=1 Tax=Chlamydomonas reinhardtii TaxID=3055 RepID=A8JF23_CHLRE|nr:uncharacterized protein CHLRE_11g467561v5 [Chlamydomonas reinhardtii]6U42_7D Chain 7D, FAP222 [Chlamydomonas reinhardtii]6U42_7E Chain 7E, FAP222 [Chlamydomonas reinhardtii]6U42_7F Chain 7F, FAP222 [Chlamydomonas reinhardtii]8GLV_7D Chain 7D, Flagellar associated protein [Chlamydomonas reinhardtii]8GLV_7E Chain 7E, Flagellar associated protein [Chlamydomonas reinhardtii]8GLV_Hk Chain Hk, Flagellar associated protein [Chlamydomonas reinhardtii]8GLV_Hl Chain Hl, Flagellar associated protein|eukprot:XP_001701412.1 flagellar associated protein [Chlamydomonas reinhardtii]
MATNSTGPWATGTFSPNSTGTVTQYNHPMFVSQRLTGNFTSQFEMNSLPSHKYETLPIRSGHLPGYQGHVPGGVGAIAQRKPAAAMHTMTHLATSGSLPKGSPQTDMSLVDLRPEQRSMAKVYMYAEGAKTSFLKFPTPKTFDHRN